MKTHQLEEIRNNGLNKGKVLLALLPYWTPQIPPVGIACLKGFLQDKGIQVKAFDLNIEERVRNIYNSYFDPLREFISQKKRGNFYNIGHDVLQNHMMAHLNYQNETEYIDLVKELVYKTYYIKIDNQMVTRLNRVVAEFYDYLEEYVLDWLEREKPGVLGLSVYKGNLPASLFVFQLAKKKFPGIKTVMGGAVFAQTLGPGTPDFDFFLEKTGEYIDHLVIGEGENLFLKLLKGEFPASQRVFTINDINNETLDLSSARLPDFSDFRLEVYPNMASYTSRSCPYQCSFCTETVYWGPYRKKSPGQIVNELYTLYRQHGNQLFLLSDSLLNPVITGLAKEFLDKDLPIYWDGYLRVDKNTCSRETAFLWRQGGFYRARLGVESGSQKVLDAMNKNIPIQNIKSTLSNLANAGIKTTNYFIIGYPGETENDFQQTLDFIEEFRDDIYEAECNPFGYYPGSQVESEKWKETKKSILLYPPSAKEMLILQTWVMDAEPKREEVYERINRFVRHCTSLGIPNPYSLYDIYMADNRWKKLHKNAVPSLIEFKNKAELIDEVKKVEQVVFLEDTLQVNKDFNF
jgi:radical SAM superfamily enzyme YgiQ (UPF0313 family)